MNLRRVRAVASHNEFGTCKLRRYGQLARVWDEHTASGNHQSRRERFPIWVPSEVMKEAEVLSVAEAESILSPWLSLVGRA